MSKSQPSDKVADQYLHSGWRFLLMTWSALFVAAGVLLVIFPPETTVLVPQCTTAPCGTAAVSTLPETLIMVLGAAAAILAVFAANGRRIFNIKAGGVEASTTGPVEAIAEKYFADQDKLINQHEGDDTPEDRLPPSNARTINIGGQKLAVLGLDDVSPRLMSDFVTGAAAAGLLDEMPGTLGDLEFAARKPGKGNNPWFLKFSDAPQAWKVSYGGQAKTAATVARVKVG